MKLSTQTLNRIKAVALLGALVAAPLLATPQSASAAPKDNRGAYLKDQNKRDEHDRDDRSRNDNDHRDYNRSGGWNNGNHNWNQPQPNRNNNWNNGWNNNWNNGRNTNRTLTGTVVSESRSGFSLRTGNRTVWVSLNGSSPRQLSRGDQVQVNGTESGNSFRAYSVRILHNR